jgi:protein-tyrosine phosphatase
MSDENAASLLRLATECPAILNAAGLKAYLHCAAGLHRTGMAAFALFRRAGDDAESAKAKLRVARPVTARDVGEGRLSWVDEFLSRRIPS